MSCLIAIVAIFLIALIGTVYVGYEIRDYLREKHSRSSPCGATAIEPPNVKCGA